MDKNDPLEQNAILSDRLLAIIVAVKSVPRRKHLLLTLIATAKKQTTFLQYVHKPKHYRWQNHYHRHSFRYNHRNNRRSKQSYRPKYRRANRY